MAKNKEIVMEPETEEVIEEMNKNVPMPRAPKTKIGRLVDNVTTDISLSAKRTGAWFRRNKSKVIGAAGLLVGAALGAMAVRGLNQESEKAYDDPDEEDEPFELDEADITELESEDLDELSVEVPDEM